MISRHCQAFSANTLRATALRTSALVLLVACGGQTRPHATAGGGGSPAADAAPPSGPDARGDVTVAPGDASPPLPFTCNRECVSVQGTACCDAETGQCGVDLGLGCVGPAPEVHTLRVDAGVAPVYGACGLPVDPGPCEGHGAAYAWVPELTTCVPFAYGGCDGNGNRFPSEAACLAACGQSARLRTCACDPNSSCDPTRFCADCPATLALESSAPCDTIGLSCDSGYSCGGGCDCVDDGTGHGAWECWARLC